MAANCPNKNSKEWKILVSQSGERLAKMAFVANNYTIPNVKTITEIKKAIGFKSKTEDFSSMADRLAKYNSKNGTAHSFVHTRIYGNTFDVILNPNYLSRGNEASRQKLARKNPILRVEGYDAQINYDSFTPSLSEQQSGYFDENGDFKPNADNIDYLPISYNLKSTNILSSDKAIQIFNKGKKAGWDLNKILTELQIPKTQKKLILDKNITDREEIITSLLAENSFVVEVNQGKKTSFDRHNENVEEETEEVEVEVAPGDYEIIRQVKESSSYYSNLTVPGGINYTENEIATPGITPNIKGHAQFSTDQGIGWFRSDEKVKETYSDGWIENISQVPNKFSSSSGNETITKIEDAPFFYWENDLGQEVEEETVVWRYNMSLGNERKQEKINTKTRRILEVQSDLFQKGRDKKTLTNSIESDSFILGDFIYEQPDKYKQEYLKSKLDEHYEQYGTKEITIHEYLAARDKGESHNKQNQFLQLLNKKGNWVNFFIQSIVQDSIKKGYEKVLFPTGNTAAKVEGHQTIADEIIKIDKKIETINSLKIIENPAYVESSTLILPEDLGYEKYIITGIGYDSMINTSNKNYGFLKNKLIYYKKQELAKLEVKKQEMKTQGLEKLKPIEAFYSNRVTNILNKLYDTKQVTDEHGNTWNEVTLDQNTQDISDDIDFMIPSYVYKQVDELRSLVPENIQEKSQILSGKMNKDKFTEVGLPSKPNKTDLEIVAIYLHQKRFRFLTENQQHEIKEWADNWLTDSFIDAGTIGMEGMEKAMQLVKTLEGNVDTLNIPQLNKNVLKHAIGYSIDNQEANPHDQYYDKNILYDFLTEKFNISKKQVIEILFEEESKVTVGKMFKEVLDFTSFTRIPRDEFIVDFFKDDIYDVVDEFYNRKMYTIPSDNIDFLLPTANSQLVDAETIRKRKIDSEIISLRRELNDNIGNLEESAKITRKLVNLKNIRDDERTGADRFIKLSSELSSHEGVLKIADRQLEEVRKMLDDSAISADNVQYGQRIVDLWLKAGDFSMAPNEHLMLDQDEFNTESIRAAFRLRKSNAEDLQRKLNILQKKYIGEFVREYTDENLTDEEIFKLVSDVNGISSRVLNVARHDNNLLQAIFLGVQEANTKAQKEANVEWDKIDKLSKKFNQATGNSNDILKQLTKDGLETGRMTHRFAHEFYATRNNLIQKAFKELGPNGLPKKDKKDVDAFFNWVTKNTITFDVRLLFEDSHADGSNLPDKFLFKNDESAEVIKKRKAAHIEELKAHLGEKGFKSYMEQQKKKIEKYRTMRDVYYEAMQTDLSNQSQAERDEFFAEQQKEFSPYYGLAMQENPALRKKKNEGRKDSFYAPKGIREYSVQIPKKFDINNNETGWYDTNFAKIEANEDILNWYNYITETMNTLKYSLPKDVRTKLGVGVLPYIEKSLMETFSEKGVMMGVVPFWDKMKESFTTTDFATEVKADINPNTGQISKNIAVPFVEDIESKVSNLVKVRIIKYKQENGENPSREQVSKFKNEIRNSLSNERSWDIAKLMKAFTLSTLAHKHKSAIQASVEMAVDKFNQLSPGEVNSKGEILTKDGKVVEDKKSGGNLKSALDFFANESFYGIASREIEGASTKKVYNSKETARKKEIENLLAGEITEEDEEILKQELEKLGAVVTVSGVGDTLLKYMTLKGLGWNTFSAFSNIGFGVISNIIEGSDGRLYSMATLRKAYMLTNNSIGRNASFNTWEGINGNALKIRTMMDQWDLLQTTNKELFKGTTGKKNPLSRFGPYAMQERSEYLNYAPVMIALMLESKASDPDGKEVSLWDAYGIDGQLKEGFTAKDVKGKSFNELKLIQKIKRVIEMNHGDYNNALQIKATVFGRAASQFRTWMFEGFANRFETEKTDWALSYGMDEPFVRKGRYRSYTKGQLVATGATVGTMFLPGIGTAIGAGAGYLGGKIFGMQTEGSVINDTLFTIKQLARKALFQKTQFDDKYVGTNKFTKTDAANMRKNMTELYLMLALAGFGLLLRAISGGDDDEKKNFVSNFLMNQINRLQTDISFYTNPMQFDKISQTMLPVFQIVTDVYKIGDDVQKFYDDDIDNEDFISGPFKGRNKALVHTGEAIPGVSQAIRLYRTGDKVW